MLEIPSNYPVFATQFSRATFWSTCEAPSPQIQLCMSSSRSLLARHSGLQFSGIRTCVPKTEGHNSRIPFRLSRSFLRPAPRISRPPSAVSHERRTYKKLPIRRAISNHERACWQLSKARFTVYTYKRTPIHYTHTHVWVYFVGILIKYESDGNSLDRHVSP